MSPKLYNQPFAPSFRSLRVWVSVLGIIVLCLSSRQLRSEENARRETAIKAAFLFHLTQFVNWPDDVEAAPDERFQIAVFEPNPFANVLDQIVASERVKGKPMEAIYIDEISQAQEAEVLFIPLNAEFAQEEAIALAQTRPLLLVGETREFLRLGGMVALVKEGERVVIVINRNALEAAGLTASSRLLRLARTEDVENSR